MVPGRRTRLSAASNRHRSKGYRRKLKSRQGISARRLLKSNFLLSFGAPGHFDELKVPSLSRDGRALPNRYLSHPEGIERRLVDRRCRGEPVIGLVGG